LGADVRVMQVMTTCVRFPSCSNVYQYYYYVITTQRFGSVLSAGVSPFATSSRTTLGVRFDCVLALGIKTLLQITEHNRE